MKMFALLGMLVSFSSFSAVIDGCYRTVSYNGAPVSEGPESDSNLTKIYSVKSTYYFNHAQAPLMTKVISIFKGFNGGWYSYINPIIFEGLGTLNETETNWNYQFEGYVKYSSSYYSYEEADFMTDAQFEWGEDGLLRGKVYQHTKALDRMIDFEVVLQKAACPAD